MRGQGREEKGQFPKGMILSCVILFLLGIGCVGMNLAAGPSEEKNPMGQIADYRKKEEKKKEAEKKKLEEQKKQKKSTDEKKNAEVYSKEIDKDIQRLKALLIAEMGTSCTAVCEQEGVNYTVTYTPVRKSIIDKDNLLRLKLEHPDIYEQFVTVSESRRFSVRASIMEAA